MNTMGRMSMGMVMAISACGALLTGCPCGNTVQVHNDTLVPVSEVYVKYRLEEDWGDNLISGNILPGETENVGSFVPGRYDVLMVYFGGAEEIDEVDILCRETYTVAADGQ